MTNPICTSCGLPNHHGGYGNRSDAEPLKDRSFVRCIEELRTELERRPAPSDLETLDLAVVLLDAWVTSYAPMIPADPETRCSAQSASALLRRALEGARKVLVDSMPAGARAGRPEPAWLEGAEK